MSEVLDILDATTGGTRAPTSSDSHAPIPDNLPAPDRNIPEIRFDKPEILDVVLMGEKLKAEIGEAITDANFELTISGASTITLQLHDPAQKLLKKKVAQEASQITADKKDFRLVKVAKTGNSLSLTFEDEIVFWMRKYKKFKKAYRGKVTRAQFAEMLAKEVREVKINFFSPDKSVKQPIETPRGLRRPPRSRQEQRRRNNQRTRGPGVTPSEKITVQGVEADREQIKNINIAMDVGENMNASRRVLVAAAEAGIEESLFRNLNYGDRDSQGVLQQRPSQGWGTVDQVRDVNRAFRKFYERAIPWAKRNPNAFAYEIAHAVQRNADQATKGYRTYHRWQEEAEKIVEMYGEGPFGFTASDETGREVEFKPYAFTRGKNGKREDTWTCLGRLADEVKWRRFVVGRTLYFISDTTLLKSKSFWSFDEDTPGIEEINFDWDVGKKAASATVTAHFSRWKIPPGAVVELKNMGVADGKWIVEAIKGSFFNKMGEITLTRPIPKIKNVEPAPETKQATGGSPGDYGPPDESYGAKGIVDQAFRAAKKAGGSKVYVVSGYRRGSTTLGGSVSDHAFNDSNRAARDIGVIGVDALNGPPPPQLDKAILALGEMFGRNYKSGTRGPFQNADTFVWKGKWRIQIIWRTNAGNLRGHMGHIHIGCRRA